MTVTVRIFRFTAAVVALALWAVVPSGARQGGGRAGGPPVQPVGQTPAGAAQPQQALTPGQAQVVGKVVEAGSSSGVAGATVLLNGPLGPATAVFTNGTSGGPRRMLADGQGQFLFRDLPPGLYTITTTAAGYVDSAYGETRIITIRRGLDLNRPLEITDTDRFVPAQIQMWKLGGISGRVLDENGDPLVGAPVTVLARMTDWGGPMMQPVFPAVQTDDRGMYHMDVTPGDYVVSVQNDTATVPISLMDGLQQAMMEGDQAVRKYVEQANATGGALLGRGVGVRVGNFSILPRSTNLTGVPPVVVINGRLMMYATTYHPGSLTAPSAGLVTLQSGEERSDVDIHVQLIDARRVSGRVVGPSGPMAGVQLALIAPDPAVTRTSPATLIATQQSVTDGNGDFTFIGVAPGPYLLRTFRPESSAASPLLWAIESVAVPSDSDVAGLQLSMKGGARVSGRIVVEGTGARPPTRQQLRALTVTARPVPGSNGAMLGTPLPSATDHPDDTHFTTSLAVPGAHMMAVSLLPPGFVLKSVTSAGQNIVDKSFDLPAAGLSDVVVTITDQISTLSGVARDEAGRPMPAATVAVFPADKSLWRLPGMVARRTLTTAPGRDGRYTFRGLPAGDYIVAAADWPVADFSDGNVLTKITPAGARITLGEGESRSQDLRVVVIR